MPRRVATPQASSRLSRPSRRLLALLPWALLFGSAVVLRALRLGLVFVDGEVRFPMGEDELYHLRRIWFSVVHFPATLAFDLYMNHPEGAAPIWPPLFDWTVAALARAAVGAGDPHAVEVFAAWLPPLIGALGVLAAAWLARRTFSPAAGFVTGALLLVQPAHIRRSALGFVDHHAALGLFATLLLAAAMRLAGPLGPAGRPRGVVATGVVVAAAIGLWPGFVLHVAAVQLFLVAQLLALRDPAAAVARARGLAVAHAVAAALLLPFCVGREWPDLGSFSPLVLSNFQPLWLGAGAGTFALLAALWSRSPLGADRARRVASAAGVGVLGLGAAWWLVPGLAVALENAAGWFGSNTYLGGIGELRPLLAPDGRFEARHGSADYSHLFWAYPVALAGLAAQALRRQRAEVLLLLFVSAVFLALTLQQRRFGDVSAAGFALVLGPALALGFRAARHRIRAPRAVWVGVAGALGLAALLPQAAAFQVEARASLRSLRGEPVVLLAGARRRTVLERAARWLKRETPATSGYLDPTARPEYGVLAAWGQGHLLRYYAERPLVQDNFGPWGGRSGFDAAHRYFASPDEDAAVAIAERLGVRYVVATELGSGQEAPRPGSQALRLLPVVARGAGLALPGAEHALERHRLIFVADDADLARKPGEPIWRVAVYEIVPGARVSGRGRPDASVRFELEVPLPGRAPVRYRARTRVNPDGRYEVRLPYPAAAGYAVSSGSERRTFELSEADVREGRAVPGPSFAP